MSGDVCSEFVDTGRCGHTDAQHDAMADGHSPENDDTAQAIRDHRLQPRIRPEDAAPAEDYECLCGDMFWGVAEWSYHVAALVLPPGPQS